MNKLSDSIGDDENGEPVYTQYVQNENHPFALFTSPDSKLREYIVTPICFN